jgi:hypothetical protein
LGNLVTLASSFPYLRKPLLFVTQTQEPATVSALT